LTGKVQAGGLGNLRRTGEMDETVLNIDRSTGETTSLFSLLPCVLRANLVNKLHQNRPVSFNFGMSRPPTGASQTQRAGTAPSVYTTKSWVSQCRNDVVTA